MTLKELKPKVLKLADGRKDLRMGEVFIPDVETTVKSYIRYLEANSGKKGYLPYYNNLMGIYKALVS